MLPNCSKNVAYQIIPFWYVFNFKLQKFTFFTFTSQPTEVWLLPSPTTLPNAAPKITSYLLFVNPMGTAQFLENLSAVFPSFYNVFFKKLWKYDSTFTGDLEKNRTKLHIIPLFSTIIS